MNNLLIVFNISWQCASFCLQLVQWYWCVVTCCDSWPGPAGQIIQSTWWCLVRFMNDLTIYQTCLYIYIYFIAVHGCAETICAPYAISLGLGFGGYGKASHAFLHRILWIASGSGSSSSFECLSCDNVAPSQNLTISRGHFIVDVWMIDTPIYRVHIGYSSII